MTIFRLIAVCALFSMPAMADTIRVSSHNVDICQAFAADKSVDKSVDYKPMSGVTMNAFDLGLDNMVIKAPIQLDLLKDLGIVYPHSDAVDAQTDLGVIELYPDGRVLLNGQEFAPGALDKICENRQGAPLMGAAEDIIEGQSDE